MNKYIKISNTAEEVSRISLEKLGLSTKRNDPETIGKFGSGIKFAPIAAIRNGWEWWFVGNDSHGVYYMQYISREEDGINCVYYDYGDSVKPSSFTIDAGSLSWSDPFQIYREAVSNAIDGAKEFNGEWSISIVDEVLYEPGIFSVFITASPEMMKIYEDHDLYFSNKRNVIHEERWFSVLEKIDNVTRVYSHDVLVHSDKDTDSIFDYCFSNIELNEERTVKSDYSVSYKMETAICNATPEMISKIISAAVSGKNYYEFCGPNAFAYVSTYTFSSSWVSIFKDMFGDNAVIIDQSTSQFNVDSSLKMRGLKPVLIPNDAAYKLLKAAGVDTAIDKLGEQVQYEIDSEISKYPKLSEAISIARIALPDIERFIPNISVFVCQDDTLGLTINMSKDADDRAILIAKHHVEKSSVNEIIATLIHEYDHASSGIVDAIDSNGRLFRELADRRIGKLVYENYRPNPFFIQDGVVCFKVSEMASVGSSIAAMTERVEVIDAYLMKIGNLIIKATGSNIQDNSITKHDPVFCCDSTVISYPTFFNVEKIDLMKD